MFHTLCRFQMEAMFREKIADLFAQRKIDALYQNSVLAGQAALYGHLVALQNHIYHLDDYLETHWHLSPAKLAEYWQAIRNKMGDFGMSGAEGDAYLAEIHQYQAQEMIPRSGGDLQGISMDRFYACKTCDIRLLRRLIYRADPALALWIPLDLWKYWDCLTEVEDDLMDMEEDRDTWNVNRYLLALKADAADKVNAEYFDYIHTLLETGQRHIHQHDFLQKKALLNWLEEAHARVSDLLSQNVG